VSVRLMSEIFQADLGSGPTPKLVLIALADFAADDGTSVYPSVKTIADKCDLSERATRYTLRKLQKAGLLEMEREASQHTSRRYLIHIEAVRGAKRAPLARGARFAPNPKTKDQKPLREEQQNDRTIGREGEGS